MVPFWPFEDVSPHRPSIHSQKIDFCNRFQGGKDSGDSPLKHKLARMTSPRLAQMEGKEWPIVWAGCSQEIITPAQSPPTRHCRFFSAFRRSTARAWPACLGCGHSQSDQLFCGQPKSICSKPCSRTTLLGNIGPNVCGCACNCQIANHPKKQVDGKAMLLMHVFSSIQPIM